MAQKPELLHKQIGNDWTPFTCSVSGGYFTPDGTISYLTMKSYAGLVSSGSLFHRSQAKTRTAWSCCQTHRGRPANQILRTCCEAQDGARPSPDWKRARGRPPILDPSDLPGHRNISDRCSAAGRKTLVLATNRNGGMLRLNASRHDDDDEIVMKN